MKAVTVSRKFQVVIPRDLRRLLNVHSGQKPTVCVQGDPIELIPEQPISAARGFLAGIDTRVEREDDRV